MKKILIILSIILSSCNSTKYISVLAASENANSVAKELNLIYSRNLFFVDGYLNGKKAKFLVDTGANISVLDINQANKYGFTYKGINQTVVGIGGHSNRYRIYNANLYAKSGQRILISFGGSDMGIVFNAMAEDGLHVVGIIGSDFLMNADAVIDYNTKTLQLYAKN